VAFHSYTEAHLATDNELVRNVLLAALLSSLAKVEAQKMARIPALSFPKITSPRIGAIRQNHRMILRCLPSSICLGSLSSTCSGRADGLKWRISSCDINSILP
jgi:hypothetical protein